MLEHSSVGSPYAKSGRRFVLRSRFTGLVCIYAAEISAVWMTVAKEGGALSVES
jgi:hypothetical protein